MFFDKYSELCKKKGKTPTGVAIELNVSRATVNYWKNGNVPKQDTLIKIANYFNVSVDYLLGNEKQKNPATDSDEMLMFALYGGDNADITPGMLEDVRNFAQYIRERIKEKTIDIN